MASKAEDIVSGLRFLADTADSIGEDKLGALIRDAVSSYEDGGSTATTRTVHVADTGVLGVTVTDNDEYGDAYTPADLGLLADENGLPLPDQLTELDDDEDCDEDFEMRPEALSHTLHLILDVVDDELTAAQAAEAAALVAPSLAERVGSELTAQDPQQNEDGSWTVTLEADDLGGRLALSRLGAGRDVFNAVVEVDVLEVIVRSQVGQPDEPEAAAEFGFVVPDLEDPIAGHQINVGVDRAAELLGERPQAATIEVTYRRTDGQELTADQTATIVAHPVSQHPTMGLPRFGDLILMEVADVEDDPSSKTVIFMVGETGEIDPAALSRTVSRLTGIAGAYGGTYPFDGLGVIECTSRVHLVEGE